MIHRTQWTAWSLVAMGVASAGCGSSGASPSSPLESPPATMSGDDGGALRPTGEEDGGGSPSISTPDDAASSSAPGSSSDGSTVAQTADASSDGSSTDDGAENDDAGSACAGGQALQASDAPGVMASSSYAAVKWIVAGTTDLVGLWTTMVVPALPAATSGTLYVWPGVQPYSDSQNFYPIGDGILQPVLSIGPTCAPGAPNDYKSWWISGQYVNPSSSTAGPTGCLGGPGIDVGVGDQLDIAMTLAGTVWTQVVTDRQTGKSVQFPMDLKGQGQNWATLAIEQPSANLKPVSDVVFTATKLQFGASSSMSCQPSQHGPTDYFATPYVSKDGETCCVSRVILRAQGVAATTMNGP